MLLERLATDFDQNMQRLLADCAADKPCSTEYPKLNDQLAALLKRVEKAPEKTTVRFNGKDLPVEVDYETLVTTLRFQMYSVFSAATLPRQIAAAAEGDLSGIANSALQTTLQLHNLVAEGLWASVICSEEAPYIETDSAGRRAAATMMGNRRVLSTQLICEDWPRSAIPEDFNRPVQADHPVLLLAGEWDVASPPDLGAKAAKTLPNGTFVEVKARSHWGISGSCVDGLVRQFVEQGSVADLDASCAAKFERPPFVSR